VTEVTVVEDDHEGEVDAAEAVAIVSATAILSSDDRARAAEERATLWESRCLEEQDSKLLLLQRISDLESVAQMQQVALADAEEQVEEVEEAVVELEDEGEPIEVVEDESPKVEQPTEEQHERKQDKRRKGMPYGKVRS